MKENVKFSSFEDYFEGFHPHSLIYSFNGCGKTTLTGRTGLRTVILDCGDAGVITLRDWYEHVKIIRIRSIEHYLDAIDQVLKLSDKIDLLVVDTLTGLQSRAIKEVKGRRGEMNQKKWGQAGGKVIECISETRNFPKDVIYLAQERRKEKDDVMSVAPSLTPSIREALSSSVDWVGRLYVEEGKRKLSFILSDYVEAKDRGDIFPKVLTLPPVGSGVYPAYSKIRQRIISSVVKQGE